MLNAKLHLIRRCNLNESETKRLIYFIELFVALIHNEIDINRCAVGIVNVKKL